MIHAALSSRDGAQLLACSGTKTSSPSSKDCRLPSRVSIMSHKPTQRVRVQSIAPLCMRPSLFKKFRAGEEMGKTGMTGAQMGFVLGRPV